MSKLGIVTSDPPQTWQHLPHLAWISSQWRTDADRIAVIPPGATPTHQLPQLPDTTQPWIVPWMPKLDFPPETALAYPHHRLAYIASASVLAQFPKPPRLAQLATNSEMTWYSGFPIPHLSENLRVLAVVPHRGCEVWLEQCLRSLANQTRPPDDILVLDDASPKPPRDIVAQFPGVQLWQSRRRVGPYALIQQAISETHYDAYLFQDADDWSTGDRLALLLHQMTQTGADLVGTQELRFDVEANGIFPVCYPLDVNDALAEKPGHPLIHPSSLVRRDLVLRLGGFATGLPFGGDTEFLLRAHFLARIVNCNAFTYVRRKRPHSLTTDPKTGLQSPRRTQLLQQLKARARANLEAVQTGRSPDLTPLSVAPPVEWRRL